MIGNELQVRSRVFFFICVAIVCTGVMLRPAELLTTVSHSAPLIAVAAGVSLVRRLGEFDLSVGSLVTLAAVLYSTLSAVHGSILAIAETVLIVCSCGAATGLILSKTRVPSLLLTFGLLWTYRGIAALLLGGYLGRSNFPAELGGIDFVSIQLALLLAVVVVMQAVFQHTPIGWNLSAISGDASQASRAMVGTGFYYWMAFALSALLCVFAAVCAITQMPSFSTMLGAGLELDALIAVFIGRLFTSGLRVSFLGSALGAIILTSIVNQVDVLGVPFETQYVFKGVAVIIVAIFVAKQRPPKLISEDH